MALTILVCAANAAPVEAPATTRYPDLVVQRIEFVDCLPRLGVTIYNQSAAPVSSSFDVRLASWDSSGRMLEAVQKVGGLGGFSTTRLIFETPAKETLIGTVDSGARVEETNESNNELVATVRNLVRCPSVRVSAATAVEGQTIRFPVRISHAFAQAVTVTLRTEDEGAVGAAFGLVAQGETTACAADFIRATGVLEFPAGTSQLTQFLPIKTCLDRINEDPEAFTVRITEVVNGIAPAQTASARGTIQDGAP